MKDLGFHDLELLSTDLYPVAVVQHRYSSDWFAIANADLQGPDAHMGRATRATWCLMAGPNGNRADLETHHATGGEEPSWMARGQTPDQAVQALIAKARQAA